MSAWVGTPTSAMSGPPTLFRVLTYGARWGKPVYDGNREEHLGIYAGFSWGE